MMTKFSLFMAVSVVLLGVALLTSLTVGAVNINIFQHYSTLWGQGDASTVFIVQHLRLPRTLLCLTVGGILGVCGVVLQGLFRNPLADPSIIGVSAGSALGAACAIVLLPASTLMLAKLTSITGFAFVGGILTTLLVYQIGRSSLGTQMNLILLSGIAIGSLAFALLGFLQFIADDKALRELTTWQLGSVAYGDLYAVGISTLVFCLIFWCFQQDSQALNALLLGENEARHLGIPIEQVKRRCIYLTALGIGVAVSVSGMIGFIGLVVPHLCRGILGPNHRFLLPASAVIGALLLLISDILARKLAAPAEIPIGIITAILGTPFFILLIIKNKQRL